MDYLKITVYTYFLRVRTLRHRDTAQGKMSKGRTVRRSVLAPFLEHLKESHPMVFQVLKILG